MYVIRTTAAILDVAHVQQPAHNLSLYKLAVHTAIFCPMLCHQDSP